MVTGWMLWKSFPYVPKTEKNYNKIKFEITSKYYKSISQLWLTTNIYHVS